MGEPAATRHREPGEAQREEQDEERAEPEARQARAGEAHQARPAIDRRPGPERGGYAERQGQAERQGERGAGQLERRGVAAGDGADDRGAECNRLPQVPARRAEEEAGVLRRERAVEAQVAAQRRHVRGRRGLAEHDLHRVAGHEVQEGEDERHHTEERRYEEHEATGAERAGHSVFKSSGGPSAARALRALRCSDAPRPTPARLPPRAA